MANKISRVQVREQDPKVRASNFEEVSYGYNQEEAMLEASRCLSCKMPACMTACPVSVKIPFFIKKVVEGDFREAARIIAIDSSLPAVCGRVCPQECQCEGSCVLGVKGEPVAIGKLERFVADWSRENGVKFTEKAPENGIKVAIAGSGPCGLACASDLAKIGYDVTIFEGLHKAGGVLEYGIPEFRLPKEKVVAAEVENVKALGVKIETNVVIGRTITIDELFDEEGFKAVFVAQGAGFPKFMDIPGENL
ncbi:MAG: FAD-dependent oxidoreductase, partial [Bacteroidales bacterium]|nr:FAD-dependent oxidoreductase [Bacteroidales bacterium]